MRETDVLRHPLHWFGCESPLYPLADKTRGVPEKTLFVKTSETNG